jgi:hypothetical protein
MPLEIKIGLAVPAIEFKLMAAATRNIRPR